MGRLGKWLKYNENNFYLFIYTFFKQLLHISDTLTDFDARWLKRRGPFGGFVDMAPHFGGQIPKKKPIWGGVNRHFQAKMVKLENLHITKTTQSISTKFCTMIKTTKYSLWVVQISIPQIQDGGRPPF